MTAEEKWKEWARQRVTPENPVVTGSIVFGLKAYKSALRKAIEERAKKAKEYLSDCPPEWASVRLAIEAAIKMYEEMLELTDTVTPEP
jgi:myo-inositol catabolism protein IolC